MTKGERNAYLNLLKTVAKSNKLDTLKGIALRDNHFETTNLSVFVRLADGSGENGLYDNHIVELLKAVPTMDIAPYKVQPIEDFPDHKGVEGRTIDLPTTEILAAMDFVSTDITRPVLGNVWLDKGEVVATDGFRIYASGHLHSQYDGIQIPLKSELLKLWKKVAKYGEWTLTYNQEALRLDNGTISLSYPITDSNPPEIRRLADDNRTFTHKAILPYSQLKKLITKADKKLTVGADGELTLSGRPLPIRAELVEETKEYEPGDFRQILCGLNNHNFALDGTLLTAYTCNSKDELVVRYNGLDFNNKVYSIE